jgi:hypothetical protein
VAAVHGAAELVVELVVPLLAVVVVVVVKVHVQFTLRLVAPATVAVRLSTCVVTRVALSWLIVTVTVLAPPLPQPSSQTDANAANTAMQLAIFRNFMKPASYV